ncbi:MAG: nicotinate-nucleotide--dimethylbenzimidazole phosphoribosyltransferase [Sphingobacteriia bacterium]|nr:MAG: nicotinate-nucleotide--dimethylbenzimidazole phosphoribosyltransferase [Sphingobacteriia bacterium]TAG30302.1 MAG: nicotinate-nucleotide--dimethylbenzimidazole phosphoribosyltransferase [Sphingobacteriia bacterium]TAH06755.1 MAG: nicotinate-nucleotide--dimethylbenzimidazole phosphoribosyltransferase [Sphingobacteriia bacterium]
MASLQTQLQHKINTKTKPVGALGMLETIALQVGLIQETLCPSIQSPAIIVFAGDHGIAANGLVNPYPQAVTAQMVLNFLAGGAAINVFTKQNNIQLFVVDAGVKADFSKVTDHSSFIHAKQAMGTENYFATAAMTEVQALASIEAGKKIVTDIAAKGTNCIGFGEMGIGNTSSAALIMSAITGFSIEECTGRGTGASDEQLANKIDALRICLLKHQVFNLGEAPIQLLSKIGGFEIAMMVGAYLSAAENKMIIVVDGFIATAALLIAQKIAPSVLNNCIFAHTSGEQGHEKMLDYLKIKPILNWGMRLGEGTGAALAIPLVRSAVAFLNEMASFEQAGVSSKAE